MPNCDEISSNKRPKYWDIFLTARTLESFQLQVKFWLACSLLFAFIYTLIPLAQAFSREYVVQDDARQYVFWMQRFSDRTLLPHDLIADYYQSITPPGYATFYWLIAKMGMHPLLLSKLLPPVLGIIASLYCFRVCMQLFPVPVTAFASTLLLNQAVWMNDDLASASPRAFVYPLFLAFFYHLLRRSWLGTTIAIALEGLFYPPLALVSMLILILRLFKWENGKIRLSSNLRDRLICLTGFGALLLVLIPYALSSSKFGPVVTLPAARKVPEFLPGGRLPYFKDGKPFLFWIEGLDSGMLPLLRPLQILIGALLPLLLKYSAHFPLSQKVKKEVMLLFQTALASIIMFFAAHALTFRLYGPSRYTQHTFRIILVIATAIAVTIILDALILWSSSIVKPGRKIITKVLVSLIITFISTGLIFYPFSLHAFYARLQYVVGDVPKLYQFFHQQPKDILVASLSLEANNLPTFAQRSTLVAREYNLPYHIGYNTQFNQRAVDLIKAQYSSDLREVKGFIKKYKIDFWLLDSQAFEPAYFTKHWIRQYKSIHPELFAQIQRENTPALSKFINHCSVLKNQKLILLQTACILKSEK